MHAALQQFLGTMPGQTSKAAVPMSQTDLAGIALGLRTPLLSVSRTLPVSMKPTKPRQYIILGRTLAGHTFRPGDWAERLAGAMSSFRPGGSGGGIGAHIGYSPYCVPNIEAGVKCVLVSEALKGVEPMAWDFVMNFARDNQLQVAEMAAKPEADSAPSAQG
jgi:hypothetical protein